MNTVLQALSLNLVLLAATTYGSPRPLAAGDSMPSFALESCRGGSVAPPALEGKVWVLAFTFAHCTLACPVVSFFLNETDELLGRPADLLWLLVTVNPDADTAEERRLHLEGLGLDLADQRWDFLGGSSAEVEKVLAQYGIVVKRQETPAGVLVEHTPLLLVADHRGRIAHRQEDYAANPDSLATVIGRLLQPGGQAP